MKKRILFITVFIALTLALSFSLAACGGAGLSSKKVEKAYKDAGYTCVSASVSGNWVVTATKGLDVVTVTGYKKAADADSAESVAKVGGSAVHYKRRGKVIAIASTSAGLNPFNGIL